jgi:hypothetical protein
VEQEGDDRGELELAEVADQVLHYVDPPRWSGQGRSKIWSREEESRHREERRQRTCQAESRADRGAAIVVEVLCSPPAGRR